CLQHGVRLRDDLAHLVDGHHRPGRHDRHVHLPHLRQGRGLLGPGRRGGAHRERTPQAPGSPGPGELGVEGMSTHTHTVSHGHAAHAAAHGHDDHEHHDTGGNTVFGFWVYLMSDCLIFASLFATYVVLVGGPDAGPGPQDLLEPSIAAWQHPLLLTPPLL